jgi:hypothetical protein
MKIALAIITYNRPDELRRIWDDTGWVMLARYAADAGIEADVFLLDDGSPGDYAERMQADVFKGGCEVITGPNVGWGGNANRGLRQIFSEGYEAVILTEDDYLLTNLWFDKIFKALKLISQNPAIGIVRLDGLLGHECQTTFTERYKLDGQPYDCLELHPSAFTARPDSQPTAYIYSNRPHILHRRAWDYYGPYPEGYKLGHTETARAVHIQERLTNDWANAPKIVVPYDLLGANFDHIGKSYQHTELDKGE